MTTFRRLPREHQWCKFGNTGSPSFDCHAQKPIDESDKPTVQNVADTHNEQPMINTTNTVNSIDPSTIVTANEQQYPSPSIDKIDRDSKHESMYPLETHATLNAIEQFKLLCQEKPVYTCCICDRLLFKKGVKNALPSRYDIPFITFTNGFPTSREGDTNLSICHCCHQSLLKKRIPCQAVSNAMAVSEQPPQLATLNTLERHLLAPVIPFMKIVALPKGFQKGIHGAVVCVQSNTNDIVQKLPRTINDGSLIKVKLKRKLKYKGHHLYQDVDPQKIKEATTYLRAVILTTSIFK
ncbi:hypothetical protein HOLleu_34066 [Holothuria leucospilota]|uniref:DUF6570 domain-containing protein n=1 Tax=Holothuria leucospilota TaxID=206669 RepID=A0A9Q1BH32_HOLLE|nr:hypothetical protein HOLleu_34066 [Holothuria leucospilota]